MTDPVISVTEPIIRAHAVEKFYDQPDGNRIEVIAPIDLNVEPGKIITLLGPSGCGKSTLLRILTGLSQPSSGEVLWHGQPLTSQNAGVAIVFQSFALFPWLTVLDNVEAPLEARGVPAMERHKRALRILDTVGLDGFESAYPKELSGGMKQRVGFARALVGEPEVLFMDEPFSALDVLTAENLRNELLELWLGKKMPTQSIFIVTHNIEEAVLMCDRIIVLSSNPGRIAAEIKVGLQHPRNRLDPEFRQLVDQIYALMTRRADMAKASPGAFPGLGMGMALPTVSTNTLAGMIEEVAAPPYDGKADLPALADSLQLEIDDLFPVAETLQLLRFAELAEGDIRLTPAGKRFAEMDVDQRKKLFGDHLLFYVPLAQRIRRVLDERPSHHAPATRFREELEDYMSEDYAETTLKSVTTWGRYGEIFAYDEGTQSFNLENPQ